MWQLLARRLLFAVPLLILVSAVVFVLMEVVPGDPALTIAGESASAEQVEEIRERLGLGQPLITRYLDWASGALSGNLGTSLFSSLSVTDAVRARFPVTLSLAIGSMFFTLLIGVSAGVIGAVRPGSWSDRVITVLASLGLAIPGFWLALILILLFSKTLGWLPPTGYVAFTASPADWLRSILMPSLALGVSASAAVARQMRSSLVGVLQRDYVTAAKARGLPGLKVVGKHGLKNASITVVTVLGLQVVNLIAASVIIEYVFALPGLGTLAIQSVTRRDIMMIQGVVVVMTLIVVAINLLVDLVYGYLNPKARTA